MRRRQLHPGPSGSAGPLTTHESYTSSVAFGGVSFLLGAILSLGTSILVARLYGIAVVGEYALALAPSVMLSTFSQVREQTGLVRELSVLPPRDPRVTGLFRVVLGFSFTLTAALAAPAGAASYFLLRGPIDHPALFWPALLLMGGYVVATNTSWNLDMVFTSFRSARRLLWVRLGEQVSFAAFALVATVFSRSVWALSVATVAAATAGLGYRVIAVRAVMRLTGARHAARESLGVLPSILRFGAKVAPGAIADGIAAQSGVWILGSIRSVASVGAYNRAWTLSTRLRELEFRVTEMLFPTLVERRADGDDGGFDRVLLGTSRYVALAMLLPAAAGGGAAVGVMNLFGPGFSQGATALAILLLIPAISTLSSVAGVALWAVDRPMLSTAITVIRLLITVPLTIGLTLWAGLTGTALGLLVGWTVDVALMIGAMRRYALGAIDVTFLRQCVVPVVAYAAGFGASRATDSMAEGLSGTFLALTAGTFVYVAGLLVTGAVTADDRGRLRWLWRSVRSRRPATEITP